MHIMLVLGEKAWLHSYAYWTLQSPTHICIYKSGYREFTPPPEPFYREKILSWAIQRRTVITIYIPTICICKEWKAKCRGILLFRGNTSLIYVVVKSNHMYPFRTSWWSRSAPGGSPHPPSWSPVEEVLVLQFLHLLLVLARRNRPGHHFICFYQFRISSCTHANIICAFFSTWTVHRCRRNTFLFCNFLKELIIWCFSWFCSLTFQTSKIRKLY